jgi:hypothetical protein
MPQRGSRILFPNILYWFGRLPLDSQYYLSFLPEKKVPREEGLFGSQLPSWAKQAGRSSGSSAMMKGIQAHLADTYTGRGGPHMALSRHRDSV